ncbi:MAG: putative endonuclease [Alphaproteobacteria bacterium]|jgi:putative endonuclease
MQNNNRSIPCPSRNHQKSAATIKNQKSWYLYVLETKYKHLYTGISLDWQRRFEEHSSNSPKCAKALKGKGPLTLQYCIELPDQRTAMQAEIWLKKQSKASKLAIIAHKKDLPFTHSIITS